MANLRAGMEGPPRALYAWYLRDWRRYSLLAGRGSAALDRLHAAGVHDRTATSPFDAHYFYLNGWAMRRIVALAPSFACGHRVRGYAPLSAGGRLLVRFVDYWPLAGSLRGNGIGGGKYYDAALREGLGAIALLLCMWPSTSGSDATATPWIPTARRKAARELTRAS